MAALTKNSLSEADFQHGLEIIREYAINHLSDKGKTKKKYFIACKLGITHATLLQYLRLSDYSKIPNQLTFIKIADYLKNADKVNSDYDKSLGLEAKKANNMLSTIRSYYINQIESGNKKVVNIICKKTNILSKQTVLYYLQCTHYSKVKNMATLEKIFHAVSQLKNYESNNTNRATKRNRL